MRQSLRERRSETFDLLVVKGLDYSKVVRKLSEKYDVSETAIETDIGRMDDWLPKLDNVHSKDGIARLRELRENRQRLQQMALEAKKTDDLEQELKIRRQIDQAIEMDIELSQSVGETNRETSEAVDAWRQLMSSSDGDSGHDRSDGV